MDAPLHVMRSSSVSDVKNMEGDSVRMSKTLPPGAISDINSHPEDYVVLDGKPVRLKKPSSAYTPGSGGLNHSMDSPDTEFLRKDKSSLLIAEREQQKARNRASFEQENEHFDPNRNSLFKELSLSRQARRILELEAFVPELHTSSQVEDDAQTLLNSSNESDHTPVETLVSARRASYTSNTARFSDNLDRPMSGHKSTKSRHSLGSHPTNFSALNTMLSPTETEHTTGSSAHEAGISDESRFLRREYDYITPTNASVKALQSLPNSNMFFSSPEAQDYSMNSVTSATSVNSYTSGNSNSNSDIQYTNDNSETTKGRAVSFEDHNINTDSVDSGGSGAFTPHTNTNTNNTTSGKVKKRAPSSLAQRLALGSTERRKLNSNTTNTTNNTNTTNTSANIDNTLYSTSSKSPTFDTYDALRNTASNDELHTTNSTNTNLSSVVRKLNTARTHNYPVQTSPTKLSSNLFSPDTTLHSITTTPYNTHTTLAPHTPLTLASPRHTPTFFWKNQKAALSASNKQDIFLFIAHDNPQLGKTVSTQLVDTGVYSSSGGGSNGNSNKYNSTNTSGSGMMCMLECKDNLKPQNTHFILGKIVYSGEYHNIEGYESIQSRGSGCIVVCELRAVKCDIKTLTTRNKNDIIEMDLINVPLGAAVPLQSEEDLRTLLRPCTERVDVILDPYTTNNQWYPYWEGARRMAPQFRSKGIGYLRLGDDMSQYGSAFLSLDAGLTYLDDGATSIVNTNTGLNSTFSSAMGTPHTFGSGALRLSRTFSGATGAGLAGALSAAKGAGKFNYTYTPTNTTNTSTTHSTHTTPLHTDTTGGASSGVPRSPRAVQAIGSTNKKLTYNTTNTTTNNGTSSSGAVSPRGSIRPSPLTTTTTLAPSSATAGSLKRTNSSNHNAVADPQWDECLSLLRECIHVLKNGETLKWTERIEILTKLSYPMHTITTYPNIHDFIALHYSILCEVISILTETIQKHTNPNVLVCSANVIGTIEYGTVLSSVSWLPWRGLLVECVHTLRSTNKNVSEAMNECLTHLYTIGSINMSTLCNGTLLSDIILGVKGGVTKKAATGKVATAANTVKVVMWLDTVCNTDINSVLHRYTTNSTSIGGTTSSTDIHFMIKTLLVLLSHREEAVRECTITLLSTLFTLDILHTLSERGLSGLLLVSKRLAVEGVQKSNNNSTGSDTDSKLKLLEDVFNPLLNSIWAEIKTVSVRVYDKIVALLAQSVSKHALAVAMSVSSSNSGNDSSVDGTGGGGGVYPTVGTTSGSNTPRKGSSNTQVSPRLSYSRVGSSASSTSNTSTIINTLTPILTPRDSGTSMQSTSNSGGSMSTTVVSPVGRGVVHTNSGGDTSSTTILTNNAINTINTTNNTSDTSIDKAKMQIGLQGIKSMRARTGSSGNVRALNTTTTTNNTTASDGTDTIDTESSSRVSSASRLRRRYVLGSNPASTSTSPTQDTTHTIPAIDTTRLHSIDITRVRSDSVHSANGNGSPGARVYTPTTPTTASGNSNGNGSAKIIRYSSSDQADGIDVITPRPVRSPRANTNISSRYGSGSGSTGNHSTPTISTSKHTTHTTNTTTTRSAASPILNIINSSNADITTTLSTLDPLWYEAKLLLKNVPTTEQAWENTAQIIRRSPSFFASLTALSLHTTYPKGAILRHILPFDENTSSNDQSKGRVDSASTNSAATPAALVGHEDSLQTLAVRASELRRVIRVKMADEADVNQAATATSMLRSFIEQLDYAAVSHQSTPLQLINRLDDAN